MSAPAAAIRAGSWAHGLPTAPPTAPVQPAPGIAGWALTYIQPLRQWFDELVGDPATVEQVAAEWTRAEADLTDIAADLARAQRQLEPLQGRTARTLDLRYEDLHPTALECAQWTGAVAAAARLASSVVAGTREFILDFLHQLERLISALFGFTLNPFDKVDQLTQLIDAASDLWRAGQRLLENMFDAFLRLLDLLSSLRPVITAAMTALRETIALMLPAVGAVLGGPLGLVLGGTARDALRDIDDVRRYQIEDMREEFAALLADPARDGQRFAELEQKIAAWDAAHGVRELTSLADLVAVNGTTDALGGAESTAIDVKLVRAADGSEHWVVSLPSTQEWLDMGGQGAMNDGKNNAALMLSPQMQTQYERAVMRAMREAGMAEGDPVVFTGFSQGGILASLLASRPDLPYEPIGVVTNGSPIDGITVPEHVPVVAFQHENDLVPKLDLNASGSTRANVYTVDLPPPGTAPGVDTVGGAHNNDQYVASINGWPPAAAISEDFSWMGGEVLDHQVFEASQR